MLRISQFHHQLPVVAMSAMLFVLPSQAQVHSSLASPTSRPGASASSGHGARRADLAGSAVVTALVTARCRRRCGARAAVKELPLPPGKLGNAMMDLLKFLGKKPEKNRDEVGRLVAVSYAGLHVCMFVCVLHIGRCTSLSCFV